MGVLVDRRAHILRQTVVHRMPHVRMDRHHTIELAHRAYGHTKVRLACCNRPLKKQLVRFFHVRLLWCTLHQATLHTLLDALDSKLGLGGRVPT